MPGGGAIESGEQLIIGGDVVGGRAVVNTPAVKVYGNQNGPAAPGPAEATMVKPQKPMAQARWLYWLPRGLALCLAALVGLFALDMFSGEYSLGEALVGFVIHLTPTWLILAALAVAWRWEAWGAGLFAALSVYFFIRFGAEVAWLLPLPALVIGALFLADAQYRRRHAAYPSRK